MKNILFFLILSLFIGCGGGGDNSTSSNVIEKNGKVQLGVLANATVKIYELNKAEKKLLFTEKTTSGESIEEIGNFNLHTNSLKDEKIYLFEASGGEDFDVDDDGVIDENPTSNKGILHLIVSGNTIKTLNKARITVVSEVLYQRVKPYLNLEAKEIEEKLKEFPKEIIAKDINGDNFIGREDVLSYNPIFDRDKLNIDYIEKIKEITDSILKNKEIDITPPVFKISSQIDINEYISSVLFIDVEDNTPITLSISGGEDSDKFEIKNFILSFIQAPTYKNPTDYNQDNIYKIEITATDLSLNKSTINLSINVNDINESELSLPLLNITNLKIDENDEANKILGQVLLKELGSIEINEYILSGEDSKYFTINSKGEIISNFSFDYEVKNSFSFFVKAITAIGESNSAEVNILINNLPDTKPILKDTTIEIDNNIAKNSIIGRVDIQKEGDFAIEEFILLGEDNQSFEIDSKGNIKTLIALSYQTKTNYTFFIIAKNLAGESLKTTLTININHKIDFSLPQYAQNESGLQQALDNSDYDYVINQLINNVGIYQNLGEDVINVNLAAAYVGKSNYTVYDIVEAMASSNENSNSLNSFIDDIVTKSSNSKETIENLNIAKSYYEEILNGVDCSNYDALTQIQKDSCYNLGLVKMTALANSVNLLFGDDKESIDKWTNGVEVNSTDDLNGNSIVDEADASACATIYANTPDDNCKDGSSYTYRGKITFTAQNNLTYDFSLLEVDVGSSANGYKTFYKLVTDYEDNNSPVLTSGVCDKNLNTTTQNADGINYFPCPSIDSSGEVMTIKKSLEGVANIQSNFNDGSETKDKVENYINSITKTPDGTVDLNNLSEYLLR